MKKVKLKQLIIFDGESKRMKKSMMMKIIGWKVTEKRPAASYILTCQIQKYFLHQNDVFRREII
jgi:hypothetical protein